MTASGQAYRHARTPAVGERSIRSAGAAERLRRDQLAFMKRFLWAFGWLAVAMTAAGLGQLLLGTKSLAFLLVAFAFSSVPVALFALALRRSPRLRARMLAVDLGPVVLFETGRILGLAFLVVYSLGKLSAPFAFWGGGLDVAIGSTALTFAYFVTAVRPFPKRLFTAWNLLGIVDFIVAWPLIFLFSATAAGVLAGSGPTTEAVLRFPLSFIVFFGVPLMSCTHMVALLQLRGRREPRPYPLFHEMGQPGDRAVSSDLGVPRSADS